MDPFVLLAAGLVVCLFIVSVRFEQQYSTLFRDLAKHPGARLVAGLLLVLMASIDPLLGALTLLILFLWLADIHLLTSIHLTNLNSK
jgi:hypothetical protein